MRQAFPCYTGANPYTVVFTSKDATRAQLHEHLAIPSDTREVEELPETETVAKQVSEKHVQEMPSKMRHSSEYYQGQKLKLASAEGAVRRI